MKAVLERKMDWKCHIQSLSCSLSRAQRQRAASALPSPSPREERTGGYSGFAEDLTDSAALPEGKISFRRHKL